MNINTEAAELLHAVADLYECGALEWKLRSPDPVQLGFIGALFACQEDWESSQLIVFRALDKCGTVVRQCGTVVRRFGDWQHAPGRNTRHVISLLRRAAQRLEEA